MNKYTLDKIIIYPIKSFAGIEVESHEALKSGFEMDRRWMLVDENNKFISQREHAILALFKVMIKGENIQINFKNNALSFDINKTNSNIFKVKIWNDIVDANEVSAEANGFFSGILNQNVKLVKLNKEGKRLKTLKVEPYKTDLNLSDGYLILGTESVNGLMNRINHPIDYRRFRPNILINTISMHEEDTWDNFKIGNVDFKMIKPCVRCNVLGIDQDNGNITKEPTRELAKYRKINNNIIFGMNAIALNSGLIELNNPIKFG